MNLDKELEEVLRLTKNTRMPFGRFGPGRFPPKGLYVYDLPYEYLSWFERKGFPAGKLGEAMKFVHSVKRDGGEAIFKPWWQERGGPPTLRPPKITNWRFEE